MSENPPPQPQGPCRQTRTGVELITCPTGISRLLRRNTASQLGPTRRKTGPFRARPVRGADLRKPSGQAVMRPGAVKGHLKGENDKSSSPRAAWSQAKVVDKARIGGGDISRPQLRLAHPGGSRSPEPQLCGQLCWPTRPALACRALPGARRLPALALTGTPAGLGLGG